MSKQIKTKNPLPYAETWGTPLGQECVSLDTALCVWLGERLLFLGSHTTGYPIAYDKYDDPAGRWRTELINNGWALLAWPKHFSMNAADEAAAYEEAQKALRWVAENLATLFD